MNYYAILRTLLYGFVCISGHALNSCATTATTLVTPPTSPALGPIVFEERARSASPRLEHVTAYYGCMCGGKSAAILKKYAELKREQPTSIIAAYIHETEVRQANTITSRSTEVLPCSAYPVSSASELKNLVIGLALEHPKQIVNVLLDGGHFFSREEQPENLLDVIERFDKEYPNVKLYVAGLDLTFTIKGFNCMPEIAERAALPVHLPARCSKKNCTTPAVLTQRLIDGLPARPTDPEIIPDDGSHPSVVYEPRCQEHWKLWLALSTSMSLSNGKFLQLLHHPEGKALHSVIFNSSDTPVGSALFPLDKLTEYTDTNKYPLQVRGLTQTPEGKILAVLVQTLAKYTNQLSVLDLSPTKCLSYRKLLGEIQRVKLYETASKALRLSLLYKDAVNQYKRTRITLSPLLTETAVETNPKSLVPTTCTN